MKTNGNNYRTSIMKMNFSILTLLLLAIIVNGQLPDRIPFRKGNLWGFSDTNKKVVIDCIYDKVFPFGIENDSFTLVLRKGKYSIINKDGSKKFNDYCKYKIYIHKNEYYKDFEKNKTIECDCYTVYLDDSIYLYSNGKYLYLFDFKEKRTKRLGNSNMIYKTPIFPEYFSKRIIDTIIKYHHGFKKSKIISYSDGNYIYGFVKKKEFMMRLDKINFKNYVCADHVYRLSNDVILIENNKKYSVVDFDNNILIPKSRLIVEPGLPKSSPHPLNLFLVDKKGDKFKKYEYYRPLDIDTSFKNSYFVVSVISHYYKILRKKIYIHVSGIIDNNWNVVLKPIYSVISTLNENKKELIEVVTQSGKQGVFNLKTKTFQIDTVYDAILNAGENLIMCSKDGKYGIIDYNNNSIIPTIYDEIDVCKDSLYRYIMVCNKDGKYGILNNKDSILLPFDYDKIMVRDSLIFVRNNYLSGFLNNKFEPVIFLKAKNLQIINNNLILAEMEMEEERYYAIYNFNGELLIPFTYTSLKLIENNLIIASNVLYEYGVIDLNNNIVINFEYDYINETEHEGIFIASKNGAFGVIDMKGNVLIPFEFAKVESTSNKNLFVVMDKKEGEIELDNSNALTIFSINFLLKKDEYYMDTRGNKYIQK